MTKRVLLVEDEALIREITTEILEENGYRVVSAANGDIASRLIEGSDGFDLLVTDIQMPGRRDGLAVARAFRTRQPDGPILYVTGRPDAMRALSRLGPKEALLRKPFGPSDLLRSLRRLLP